MASTITPPPGRRALAMNNKQMTEQYKVKTGPGRKDTLSHKLFLKTEMMCVGGRLVGCGPAAYSARGRS